MGFWYRGVYIYNVAGAKQGNVEGEPVSFFFNDISFVQREIGNLSRMRVP